jgi:hypothetical protein
MSIKLVPKNIYGSTQYVDETSRIVATQINDKWYPSKDGMLFDAGFCNINCMQKFFNELDEHEESLTMLGYHADGAGMYLCDHWLGFEGEITVRDDGVFNVTSRTDDDGKLTHLYHFSSDDFSAVEEYILNLFDKLGIDPIDSATITSSEDVSYVIECKTTSRDLSKNLVRVKSSNMWSYGINIKDRKDKTGDVIVQFKDVHGGPGDVYQYFDVPVNLWRKWLAAPSKGHFLWQYIRNEFKYRKLTGDKRGKLPNAVN